MALLHQFAITQAINGGFVDIQNVVERVTLWTWRASETALLSLLDEDAMGTAEANKPVSQIRIGDEQ